MFANQLRAAIAAAPRVELTKISALLWRAYAAGQVTEAEASELSDLIEARKAIPAAQKPMQRRLGSRPRSSHPATWNAAGAGPPPDVCRPPLPPASPWRSKARWP